MVAYTYLIIFKPTGQAYYGVRFANIKPPDKDLWIEYFTSSRKIKRLIKEHGEDSFDYQVRKIFNDEKDAIKWEKKVLRRTNAIKKDHWLNKNVGGSLDAGGMPLPFPLRPVCIECRSRPAASNYISDGKRHYRKKCNTCIKGIKRRPLWEIKGYTKKSYCEKCGFKAKIPAQTTVYYMDSNLNRINWNNIKTVCLNCNIQLSLEPQGWTQGDLIPDR